MNFKKLGKNIGIIGAGIAGVVGFSLLIKDEEQDEEVDTYELFKDEIHINDPIDEFEYENQRMAQEEYNTYEEFLEETELPHTEQNYQRFIHDDDFDL